MRRRLCHDSHEFFRQAFRAFLEQAVVPQAEEWEQANIVDREMFMRAGGSGFLGIAVPEVYGGSGTNDFRYIAVIAGSSFEPESDSAQAQY